MDKSELILGRNAVNNGMDRGIKLASFVPPNSMVRFMDLLKKYLGFRLKKARKSVDVTQAWLAKKISKSRATIANYEEGTQAFSITTAYEMAENLDLRISIIIPDPLPPEEVMKIEMLPTTKCCPKCGGSGEVKIAAC